MLSYYVAQGLIAYAAVYSTPSRYRKPNDGTYDYTEIDYTPATEYPARRTARAAKAYMIPNEGAVNDIENLHEKKE